MEAPKLRGGQIVPNHALHLPLHNRLGPLHFGQSCVISSSNHFCTKLNRSLSVRTSRIGFKHVEAVSIQPYSDEVPLSESDDSKVIIKANNLPDHWDSPLLENKPFKNRFLNIVRLGSLINNAAESFFKSEIRRRLFVTAALLILSRVGYFIPLPGFDRRLIPRDYLSFVTGSLDEHGDYASELKMSLFQLGISPQIMASILMQILCHIVPSLIKLRKEGLDGHEKIKSYIWWISLGFAILEALIVACYSLQYSVYAAGHRVKHVMVTSLWLVCGAMTMTWICDKISEAGFGQGSSLVICVGILTSYTDTLYKMLSQLSVVQG